ncbi:MAG: glutamate-cysteine ligase family protein [Candidatus Asgardarchaeum sp.]
MVTKNQVKLPYTQGIEVELGIIKNDGKWIMEEEFIEKFKRIIKEAGDLIKRDIEHAPEYIRNKIIGYDFVMLEKKGFSFQLVYKLGNREVKVDLISRDPNISRTFILEIATPPCEFLGELIWWLHKLIRSVNVAVKAITPYVLIGIGLNPLQKYSVGLSYGEHHHLGIEDMNERIAVYNMIRNFIPHLIALSANSPFEDGLPTDNAIEINRRGYLIAPNCIRSIRLLKNDHQLGPSSHLHYVPYLKSPDINYFVETTGRRKHGGRLVDLYPFTIHGTIEIRIFDTQYSISRMISLALLLEAIALKAKKIYQSKGLSGIPSVSSEIIVKNREEAIQLGLQGMFHPDKNLEKKDPVFAKIYNYKAGSNFSEENRFLNDAVIGLIYFIKEELEELGFFENPLTQPLLVTIFGSEKIPPMYTPADYLLRAFIEHGRDGIKLLEIVEGILSKSCENLKYDPLQESPSLPIYLLPERAISLKIEAPEIAFSNRTVPVSIRIINSSEKDFENLSLYCKIEDVFGNVIKSFTKHISILRKNEKALFLFEFFAGEEIKSYNIIAELKVKNAKISVTRIVSTYSLEARISTDIFAVEPDTPIDYHAELKNNSPVKINARIAIVVIDEEGRNILSSLERRITIPENSKIELTSRKLGPLVVENVPLELINKTCRLYLEVYDERGQKIASSKSGKIVILTIPPEVNIRQINNTTPIINPLKSIYYLGENVFFNFVLSTKGYFPDKKFELKIDFVSEKSGVITIYDSIFDSDLGEIPFSLSWKIPEDLILHEGEDYARFIIKAISNGKIVGYYESAYINIQKSLPIVRAILDVPRVIMQGDYLSGSVFFETQKTLAKGSRYTIKLHVPQINKEIVLEEGILEPKTSMIIEIEPVLINYPEGYMEIVAEIYENNKQIIRYSTPILVKSGKIKETKVLNVTIPDEVEIGKVLEIPCKIIWNRENSNLRLIIRLFSPNIGTINELEEPLKIKKGEFVDKKISIHVPLFAEASKLCIIQAMLFSGEEKIDETQKQAKIKLPKSPLLKVTLDIKTEDNLPIPDVITSLEKIIIEPTIKSDTDISSPIQLIIHVDISPGKSYKISYPPFTIKKGEIKRLKIAKIDITISKTLTKIRIFGEVYQKGIKIKSTKVSEKVFFVIPE